MPFITTIKRRVDSTNLSHNGVPVIEGLRFEGNLPYLGARAPNMMDFICPDGAANFRTSDINMGCLYHV